MSEAKYELTSAQAAFLETVLSPSPAVRHFPSVGSRKGQFPGTLPPVTDQAVRGTCVANAVAALVACYEGCRRRVSVQYLDEVTRLVEQDWVSRNLKLLMSGEQPEKDFEAAFPEAVSQAALLVKANGAGSEAANAFVRALGTKIRARVEADSGCRLKRCFEALEEYGVCREDLWPYSPVAMNAGAAGGDAVGEFPPGTHEDARRHRIVNGLYVLRAPNNVDEIKGILIGAHGRRSMPVCVGLELFEGCTEGSFTLPRVERADGMVAVEQRPLGIHEVLIVGYQDDAKAPGGGFFTFMNSWGRAWGDKGMGRVSYAYVACFCREAGTILQESEDYDPVVGVKGEAFIIKRRRLTMLCAVGICLAAAIFSVSVSVWSMRGSKTQEVQLPPMVVKAPPSQVSKPQQRPAVQRQPLTPTSMPVAVSANDDDDDGIEIVKVDSYYIYIALDRSADVDKIRKELMNKENHPKFAFERIEKSGDEKIGDWKVVLNVERRRGGRRKVWKLFDGFLKKANLTSGVRIVEVVLLW